MATETHPRRKDLNYKELSERLEARANRLEREIDELRAEERNTDGELASYDQHDADQGTETYMRERDLAILKSEEEELAEIRRAQTRMEAGSYGYCERCDKPIQAARLDALPFTSVCLDCAL